MTHDGLHLLVGTTKGAFILDGAQDRTGWTVRGPFCDGWTINHVVADPVTGTMWAGGGNDWTGAGVWRSADGGPDLGAHEADDRADGRLGSG
jgi:hypothetical protein